MQPNYGRPVVQPHVEFFGEHVAPFDFETPLFIYIGESLDSFARPYTEQNYFVPIEQVSTYFRMKSTSAVHPLTNALWSFNGEVTYVGDVRFIETVYQLMCVVKSYNKRAKYALYDTKTRKFVTEPDIYLTPFNIHGQAPKRKPDIDHLRLLTLMYNDIKTRTNVNPEEGFWYRNNPESDIMILFFCWRNCYATSIGDIRLQYSTNEAFRTFIMQNM